MLDHGETSAPARAEEVIRVGDHFYVLAVAARADERSRVLKHGDTFGVFDAHGDVLAERGGDHGLYHKGMRHLSRLGLSVNGLRPLLLGSSADRDNIVLGVDETNPDLSIDGEIVAPRGAVHIRRSWLVWAGVLHCRLHVHNFSLHPVGLRLELWLDADFADMFEVRGVRRRARGRSDRRVDGSKVRIEYEGLDGVTRRTVVAPDREPSRVAPDRLTFELSPGPDRGEVIEVKFICSAGLEQTGERPFSVARGEAEERTRSFDERVCEITTNSETFNEWVRRSRADLRLMISRTPHGLYPYAGVPWFSTPFGRDGIITALQTLWTDPELARGVLVFLAATQAKEPNPSVDAEPGKIVHEIRDGEMAATGEVPYAKYYGSIDSTPLFALLAGEYLRATGDLEFIRSIWPAVSAALEWIDGFGDLDGDGFVEYFCRTPGGLANQGWKDSNDSVFHKDGSLAEAPIALAEVQAYAYAARMAGADIAEALGERPVAQRLRARANDLRERFGTAFWDDDLGMYVLALDRHKRPCRIASSNAGQCLFTGIAHDDHAQRLMRELLGPRMFSGWGVRTVGMGQARYNPMSYHDGSIWPHDTSLIALGLARHGGTARAASLMDAMHDLAQYMEQFRLPELVCGFERTPNEGPVRYPVACSPQSWASGVVFMMLRACLGLELCADRREILLHDPQLPEFLEMVHLRNIRVGSACVDLMVQRGEGEVSVNLVRRATGVRVIVSR